MGFDFLGGRLKVDCEFTEPRSSYLYRKCHREAISRETLRVAVLANRHKFSQVDLNLSPPIQFLRLPQDKDLSSSSGENQNIRNCSSAQSGHKIYQRIFFLPVFILLVLIHGPNDELKGFQQHISMLSELKFYLGKKPEFNKLLIQCSVLTLTWSRTFLGGVACLGFSPGTLASSDRASTCMLG